MLMFWIVVINVHVDWTCIDIKLILLFYDPSEEI